MNQQLYQRAAELFLELNEKDVADRGAWLDEKTDDPAIRQLVLDLCAEDERFNAAVKDIPTSDALGATVTGESPYESTVTESEPARLEEFGDYSDLVEIGRGGLGIIYRAHQLSLNRTVAIKMIRASSDAAPAQRLRFCLEAETAAKLEHPNIVPIYEVGAHLECPFFAMKLIEGPNLAKWLRESDHSIRDKVEIMIKVSRAIQHAHENGVLHRDLKPANVLIDAQNEPHVTDFGLAKQFEHEAGLTATGQILGTPSYMSPEQASAKHSDVTIASDVYGLGAILYECLTGKPPFRGDNVYAIMRNVVETDPESLSRVNTNVDRDLNTICLKCLSKAPAARYATASELAQDLERWLEGRPISARPVSVVENVAKWARRKPAAAGLLVALVALVLVPSALTLILRSQFSRGRRADRAAEMVEIIRTGDTARILPLIDELTPLRDLTDDTLREQLSLATPGTRERFNLALALLPSDATVGEEVVAELGQLDDEAFVGVASHVLPRLDRSLLWGLLKHSNDPTLRSRVVSHWSELGVGLEPVRAQLSGESRVDVRRALTHILATARHEDLPTQERENVVGIMRRLFLNDPDPGIHSACLLGLKEWGVAIPAIKRSDETPDVRELTEEINQLKLRRQSIQSSPAKDQREWEQAVASQPVVAVDGDAGRYEFDDPMELMTDSISGTSGQVNGTGKLERVPALIGDAIRLTGEATVRCDTDFRPDFDTPFSYGCWLLRKVREGVEEDEYGTVLSRLKPGGGGGFDLWMNNGSLSGHQSSKDGFRGGMVKVAGRDRLPTDRWLHVFVTVDGSGEAAGMKLYVDGKAVETVVFEPRVSYSIRADADFFIGQRAGDLSQVSTYPFLGLVDDVRLFERELTPEEIASMYWGTVSQVAQIDASQRSVVQQQFLEGLRTDELLDDLGSQIQELESKRRRLTWRRGKRWYENPSGITFAIIYEPPHEGGEEFNPPFAIATTPVTIEQFLAFRPNASFDETRMNSRECPMNSVSRHDAAAYCNWLSEQDGLPESEHCYEVTSKDDETTAKLRGDYRERLGYRLPTLEEWQYACRGCTTTRFFFGDDSQLFPRYGWDAANSKGRTSEVALKLPNDFGLFDVHGGVWEWCLNGERDDARLTGGSLRDDPSSLVWNLSQSRNEFTRDGDVGFRVVRKLP
ncbi:MAG: protein kinase [Planctomycetota bacterium]